MFSDFFFEGKQEEHHGAPNQVVQGLFTHLPPYTLPPIEITFGIAYSCFMVQKILITTLIAEHFLLLPKILTKLGLFV
jgi:hypothetical protein